MILNLNNEFEINKAKNYFSKLIEKEVKIELKEIKGKRSNSQNAYFYAILGILAIETGYSIEEMKTVLKRKYGIFYEKNGQKFIRSTKDLSTGEMKEFTEKIRNQCAKDGLYIMSPEEYAEKGHLMDEYINNNRVYL